MIHRWLRIGTPEREARDPGPDLTPLANLPVSSWGMEVSRSPTGQVSFRVLAPGTDSMTRIGRVIDLSFPHVAVGGDAPCAAPATSDLGAWRFARARPSSSHHYWPLNIPEENDRWMTDYQEALVSGLGGPSIGRAQVCVQVLAERVGAWESGLFSSRYSKLTRRLQGHHETVFNGSWESTPTQHDLEKLKRIERRQGTPAFHVELRVAWKASPETKLLAALRPWLAQWTSLNGGGTWRWFEEVLPWPLLAPHRAEQFAEAFSSHSLAQFSVRREARDVSASELATMLAPPWRRAHPSLAVPKDESTASALHLPPGRVVPLPGMPRAARDEGGWVLGSLAGTQLRLPPSFRHMAVIGGTGTGKSTLLLNSILQLVGDPSGGTVVLLDPTGALVADVKSRLPLPLARETVEFDPSQLFFTKGKEEWVAPGFNFLDLAPAIREDHTAFDRSTSVTISDLIRSFHDAWGTESVGARAGYFMTALLKGLMQREGTTLLDVRDIITNKDARERYLRWLPPGSGFLSSFVKDELPKYRLEDFISTLDKTGWFGGSHLLRGALCQREKPARFADFLNHRLVLLNISRGLVGDQNCKILGSAFLSMLWSERLAHGQGAPPLTLVIDEAQTFALPSLVHMLTEGRKYGVRVVLANQYFRQLPDDLRASIEGNVDVWCCFRTGPEDARAAHKVTRATQWDYSESRFVSLPDHHFVCNILTHSNQGFWETAPAPPALPEAGASERLIRENVRKAFSARETSEASPFLVDQETLGPVCFAISQGTTLLEAIAEELGLSKGAVFAALRRGEDLGYIAWNPKTKENRLTPLGEAFVDAWGARRVTETEGELHMDLLARASDFLKVTWGIELSIIPQGANPRPLPDGTFEKGGIACNLEVECSTLATKGPQVVKNVQKSRDEGRRCLFVVQSQELADRLVNVLEALAPQQRLGRDFAIIAWGEGRFRVIPGGLSSDGFPFAPDLAAPSNSRPAADGPASSVESSTSCLPPRSSYREVVRGVLDRLIQEEVSEFSGESFLEAIPETERGGLATAAGKPSGLLGRELAAQRIPWVKRYDPEKGNMVRVYLLSRARVELTEPAPTSAAEET